MHVLVFPGGWECDAHPSGAYVVAYVDDRPYLSTHRGDVPYDSTIGGLRYPRLTLTGGFKIAGQGRATYRTPEWVEGVGWTTHEENCGVSPVIYDRTGTLHISYCGPVGSQGYRYVDPDTGALVTGDATYLPAARCPFHQWTYIGRGLYIGQGTQGGVSVWDGIVERRLAPGNIEVIRALCVGDDVSIAYWHHIDVPSQAVISWLTVAELLALPVVGAPAPSPAPLPPPPPIDIPLPGTCRLHACALSGWQAGASHFAAGTIGWSVPHYDRRLRIEGEPWASALPADLPWWAVIIGTEADVPDVYDSKADQIAATVAFARERNLRVICYGDRVDYAAAGGLDLLSAVQALGGRPVWGQQMMAEGSAVAPTTTRDRVWGQYEAAKARGLKVVLMTTGRDRWGQTEALCPLAHHTIVSKHPKTTVGHLVFDGYAGLPSVRRFWERTWELMPSGVIAPL